MSLRRVELQFNNSHERSQGKSAKHLKPQAICRMIYEFRQNGRFSLYIFFLLLSHSFHLQLFEQISVSVALQYYSPEIGSMPHFTRHTINVIIFVLQYFISMSFIGWSESFLFVCVCVCLCDGHSRHSGRYRLSRAQENDLHFEVHK